MGTEWIRADAGYRNAHPSLGNLASPAANTAAKTALQAHVQPFAVPEKHKFGPNMKRWDWDRHEVALNRAIERWKRSFAKARKQVTDAVYAAAWPPYRDELRARAAELVNERAAAAERKAKEGMTFNIPIRRETTASSKQRHPTRSGPIFPGR